MPKLLAYAVVLIVGVSQSSLASGAPAKGKSSGLAALAHQAVSEDDVDHTAFALNESRVIVTHDVDFLRAASAGEAHAGITNCHQQKYAVGQLLQALLLLSQTYSAEEMAGRVEFL